MVVWTPRDDNRHVMSMRKCNEREKARFRARSTALRAKAPPKPEWCKGDLMAALREHVSNTWRDPDDAPEWTAEQFERADLYRGNKLVRAGRPPSANPKQALKLRIDPDVVEYFRATGPGWQTRINDTLRKAAKLPAKFGERPITAAREGVAIARGELDPASYRVHEPDDGTPVAGVRLTGARLKELHLKLGEIVADLGGYLKGKVIVGRKARPKFRDLRSTASAKKKKTSR